MKTAQPTTVTKETENMIAIFAKGTLEVIKAMGAQDIATNRTLKIALKNIVEAYKMADMNNYARERGRNLPHQAPEFERLAEKVSQALQEYTRKRIGLQPIIKPASDLPEPKEGWFKRSPFRKCKCAICDNTIARKNSEEKATHTHFYQRGKSGPRLCPDCYKKHQHNERNGESA